MAATSPEQIPDTQRAWVIVRKGVPARALELNEAYPVPKQLAAGEVLVRVQAAAFNPVYVPAFQYHVQVLAGKRLMHAARQRVQGHGHAPELPRAPPARRGARLCGRRRRRERHRAAERAGGVRLDPRPCVPSSHPHTEPNQTSPPRVIPTALKIKSKQGALCEYVRVPARLVLPKPAHLKPTEAAGLALAGGTAYHALHTVLKLEPGQRLFINGGSTSVGIYAIQMARALGCSVAASASPKKEEFVRSLGADTVRDTQICRWFPGNS